MGIYQTKSESISKILIDKLNLIVNDNINKMDNTSESRQLISIICKYELIELATKGI